MSEERNVWDLKHGIHRVCWQCYRSNKCNNNYPSQKSKSFHEFMQISKGNEHPMRPLQRWADLHCKPLEWHITMKEDKDICYQGMEGRGVVEMAGEWQAYLKTCGGQMSSCPLLSCAMYLMRNFNSPLSFCTFRCSILKAIFLTDKSKASEILTVAVATSYQGLQYFFYPFL